MILSLIFFRTLNPPPGPVLTFWWPGAEQKMEVLIHHMIPLPFSYDSYIFKIDRYIKPLPRESSSSPLGISRVNSGTSMCALRRRKIGSVGFRYGPR